MVSASSDVLSQPREEAAWLRDTPDKLHTGLLHIQNGLPHRRRQKVTFHASSLSVKRYRQGLELRRAKENGGADTTITAAANCLLLPHYPPLSPVVFTEQTVTRPRDLTDGQ